LGDGGGWEVNVSYYNKREIIRQPVDVLRHEAGHMAMAKVLGFDTGILTYSPACAGAQIVLDLPLPDIPTLVNFIERRTMVLYAGSMAEALNADASDIDGDKALGLLKEIEGLDDSSKAREILRILTSLTYEDGAFLGLLRANNDRLWKRSGEIILKHGRNIVGLSKEWRLIIGGRDSLDISKDQIEAIAEWSAIQRGSEKP
jgi:hypothetical protein